MSNRTRVIVSIVVGIVALVYDASPVDIVPELFTGPLGLIDDGGVTLAAVAAIISLIRGRTRVAKTSGRAS